MKEAWLAQLHKQYAGPPVLRWHAEADFVLPLVRPIVPEAVPVLLRNRSYQSLAVSGINYGRGALVQFRAVPRWRWFDHAETDAGTIIRFSDKLYAGGFKAVLNFEDGTHVRRHEITRVFDAFYRARTHATFLAQLFNRPS